MRTTPPEPSTIFRAGPHSCHIFLQAFGGDDDNNIKAIFSELLQALCQTPTYTCHMSHIMPKRKGFLSHCLHKRKLRPRKEPSMLVKLHGCGAWVLS